MVPTCFECGIYTEIKSTSRHEIPWSCEHKLYNYARKNSKHEDLEYKRPDVKDFSASAYPVKNILVYPLSAIEDSGLYDVEVGDVLQDRVDMPRVSDRIEVTGIVRHWDRVEIYYEEVKA